MLKFTPNILSNGKSCILSHIVFYLLVGSFVMIGQTEIVGKYLVNYRSFDKGKIKEKPFRIALVRQMVSFKVKSLRKKVKLVKP